MTVWCRIWCARPIRALRHWLRMWLLACSLVCLSALAAERLAQAPIVLSDRHQPIDVWPAVSVLYDERGQWTLDEVRTRLPQRERPMVPAANFGERRGAVWLVWEIELRSSALGTWLLYVGNPQLDLVDLQVLHDGRPLPEAAQRAGDARPLSWRALPTRTHVLPLDLAPGRYTLVLRVASEGTVIAPIRFVTPDVYHQGEDRVQLVQGISTGVMLCLLLYSLTQWFSLRDALFLYYGLSVFGIGLYLFSYNGLGLQHLWGEHVWVSAVLSPACVLLSALGAFLFIDRVLDIRGLSPLMSRVMHAGAWAAAVSVALLLTDVIGYRSAQQMAKLMGQLPMFLALPFAWMRWRQGDRAAAYVFVGWALYAVGGVTMARLVNGQVPATVYTMHALQVGSLVEMVLWLLVMGMRVEQLRGAAERATRDSDRLRQLADTDALTGLLNRRGLHGAVLPLLARAHPDRQVALYLIDLDGFKQINDRLGHDAGDAVLVEAGVRLRRQVRETDLAARTGGDEFVVLVSDLPDDAAARRIGTALQQALVAPMLLRAGPCVVGATIGYALSPVDGWDVVELMRRADQAMYLGKQAGKGQVRRLAPA